MSYRVRCFVCPWKCKASNVDDAMIIAEGHQQATGHVKMLLKERTSKCS